MHRDLMCVGIGIVVVCMWAAGSELSLGACTPDPASATPHNLGSQPDTND